MLLNLTNFSKGKSLYRDGMSPLVKSTSRPTWQRLPSRSTYYYKCPRHKMNYVLSFVFEFDSEDDTYYFAYSYPYTYSDLQVNRAAHATLGNPPYDSPRPSPHPPSTICTAWTASNSVFTGASSSAVQYR